MTAVSSSYRRAGGLTLTLQILGVIDLLLCLASLVFAWACLAARHLTTEAENLAVGGTGLILMLQVLLRTAALIVRARWSWRLVVNARLVQAFPVSPFWAWAGFFLPVASLWLPASTLMALSCMGMRQNRVLNPLCLVWAIVRWLTSPSGATMIFFGLVARATYRDMMEHHPANSTNMMLTLFLILAITGALAVVLGLVLTTWITGRQPRPDQLHHAEVF